MKRRKYSTGVARLTCDDLGFLGMEAQQSSIAELSDYGSNFDTDEEAIVSELLKDAGSVVPYANVIITEENDRSKDGQSCHPQGYLRLSSISAGPWLRKEAGSIKTGSLTSVEESGTYCITACQESWLIDDQACSSNRR